MPTIPHTLIAIRALTHDVFELVFRADIAHPPIPWQFSMFSLPSGLRRAYSVAWHEHGELTYIIKRLEGGPGSTEICGLTPGAEVAALPPVGKFQLSEGDVSRCFIGTGTGFAPLWFQIRSALEREDSSPMHFVFGVREARDRFYQSEIWELSEQYPHFSFTQYLSREDIEWCERWYVTDPIGADLARAYKEFYICGSPAMVSDARTQLEMSGVHKERIRFEQY